MNRFGLRLLLTAAALTAAACSKSPTTATNTGSPTLAATASPTNIVNDGTKTNILITARDKDNKPASGTVNVIADKGDVNGTGATQALATLSADGTVVVSFACDVKKDATCTGRAKLTAGWQGATSDLVVTLNSGGTGSTGGSTGGSTTGTTTGTTGAPDSGPSLCDDPNASLTVYNLNPSSVGVAGGTLPSQTTLVVLAQNPDGTNAATCPVYFAETAGENLVSLSVNAAFVGGDGTASVTVNAGQTRGDAHIAVRMGEKALTVTIPVVAADVPDAGGLTGATINVFSINPPPPLNTSGTGNSVASVTFMVRYANNQPASGVQVAFSELVGETLVSLSSGSGVTDAAGLVSVSVTAGSQSGPAHIIAALTNGTSTTSTLNITAGQTDGGACAGDLTGATLSLFTLQPSAIGPAGSGLSSTATLVVSAKLANNDNASGCLVEFAEQSGENLVSLSNNGATVDPSGRASVSIEAGQFGGLANIVATFGSQTLSVQIPVVVQQAVDGGGLSTATLDVFSINPAALDTVNSGNTNTSNIQLLVRLADGTPLAGAQVLLAEDPNETLVALSGSSALTNASGLASFSVTSGGTAGVAHITATLATTSTVQHIAIPISDVPNLGGSTLTLQGLFPSFIVTQGGGGGGVSTSTQVTLVAQDATAAPIANQTVTLTETLGENLVNVAQSTVTTSSSGVANFTVSSKTVSGNAHLTAVLSGGVASVDVVVPILGAPSQILFVSQAPSLLGIQGSGIQETGEMVFQVTDAVGNPVPSKQVDFTQTQPNLVTINTASAFSDSNGNVTVAFASGPEVGVSSIIATVNGTSVSVSHPVAVRGAKPSAAGFYFQCEQINLPVYDLTTKLSQTTCHVRLTDRRNNRVGIPTPVNFAAESGAITASVTTKAYDPANPDVEGTADVIFTTDFGQGGAPADVTPLPADASQAPFARSAEPSRPTRPPFTNVEANPRDQLVTIIAMTQGEEAFFDANRNNQLDPDELFIDLSAPYIDANDDNVYDQVRPGGPYERFFCANTTPGQSCSAFQGPNGVWDSTTTIWTPTWVVFTGASVPVSVPATAWQNGSLTATPGSLPACLSTGASTSLELYAYDEFLNHPAPLSIFPVTMSGGGGGLSMLPTGLLGSTPLYDSHGSMNFAYATVSESDGGSCTTSNGNACVNHIVFGGWDTGDLGAAIITNPPVAPCTAGQTTSCVPFVLSATAVNSLASGTPGGSLSETNAFSGGQQVITCN